MSVGVGRGRGRLPQQSSGEIEPLRRPNMSSFGRGRTNVSVNSTFLTKYSEVETAISDVSIESQKLFKVLDNFLQTNPSQDEVNILIKKIFEKASQIKLNLDCICQCLYLASKHKLKGDVLLMSFFTQLEKKFTEMVDEGASSNLDEMWKFMSLFSSACQYSRNQKSPPFKELIDGLNKLCTNAAQPLNTEEARIAALCIARCCHYMKMANRPAALIEALMIKLRSNLQGCSTFAVSDPNMMLWSTLGLESASLAGSGAPLPPASLQYYCRVLGREAAAFNIIPAPAVNLPSTSQNDYNFSDTSYIVNFT